MTEKQKMLKTKPKNSKKRRTPADIVEGSKKGLRNRETNIISFIFVGLFAIMIIYLCMFNIKDAKNVINNPYNKRVDNQAEKVVRGDIYSADGTLLATTDTDENGVETEVTTSCKCVRVIQGEQVVFKRLDVIFEGNNYVLSAEKNDDNDYLSLYDEIIVEGVD